MSHNAVENLTSSAVRHRLWHRLWLWLSVVILIGPQTILAANSHFLNALNGYSDDVFTNAIPVQTYSFERDEDRDYDKQPDDWTRRRGIEFRQYVDAEIDYQQAYEGQRSLRIDANGSGAIYYSPPIPIDSAHDYVMEAAVLTRGLKHDAAMVSFSFLDHRKKRVQRILTPPVSGTLKDWAMLKVPPVSPHSDVKFVVVGCHLVHSENMDLSGSAWFDRIRICKLPALSLASNFETHFRESDSEISIQSRASGLDPTFNDESYAYTLHLQVEDVTGAVLDEIDYDLEISDAAGPEGRFETSVQEPWKLPVYPPGYYRVGAALQRNGLTVVRKYTAFAVLNLRGRPPLKGEFGWNLCGGEHHISQQDLLAITSESGINWVKVPVWQDAYSNRAAESGEFLTQMRNQSINPVGMLTDPPDDVRRKFAADWTGVSELFVSPPIVWREAANQVMALYSPTVTRWQLGDDNDTSFVGMPNFFETTETIRRELQRIGQIRQLGVRWNVGSAVPRNETLNRNFLVVPFFEEHSMADVRTAVREVQAQGFEAWVVVRADRVGNQPADPHERAYQLMRRMVDAKRTGCEFIFAYDVFDEEFGLLEPDGSPSALFLPWRTTALALNNSTYAGSIQLPGNSTNHVFFNEEDAVMVVWNNVDQTEEIYLGDDVIAHNAWGAERRLLQDPRTGRQTLEVSSTPLVLTGCSRKLMEWRMGVSFKKGRIASSLAEHEDTLYVKNVFPWGVQGTVQILPKNGWEVSPSPAHVNAAASEEVEIPFGLKVPSQTNLGEQMMALEFDLGVAGIGHPFRVYRNYAVGMGDVRMDVKLTPMAEGGIMVEQTLTNKTNPPESLDLRCHLLIRGRRRQVYNMDGLLSGQSSKAVYYIQDFDDLVAKDLWLRAEQKNGRRTLNDVLEESRVMQMLEESQ